jgi:hypothetical protein
VPAYFQRKLGQSIRPWDAYVGGAWCMDGQSAGTDGDPAKNPGGDPQRSGDTPFGGD